MKAKLLLALISFLIYSSLAFAADKVKIVFLHGDRSHSSGDHEFKAGSHLLANHLRVQTAVPMEVVVNEGWPKDESILDDAKAIVVYCDATEVVQNGWEKMDSLAKKGVGFLFMHYGVHPAEDKGEQYFKNWIGGYFKTGKSVNPFWRANIETMKGHPISNGITKVEAIDEWYFNLEYAKGVLPLGVAIPNEHNLAFINNLWTQSGYESKDQPQALLWGIVREDGSRGAGFTGGHRHQNWAFDDYRKMILNTIFWISGQTIPADGVPTAAVSEDELNQNLDDYGDKTNRIKLPTAADLAIAKNGPWLTPEEHVAAKAAAQQAKKKSTQK